MHKSNYVVYDCETGGLEETENPITQFACQVLDFKTLKVVDQWETFVKPYEGLKITQKSLDKTMVSMSDINSGITVKQFDETFSQFFKMHNASGNSSERGRLVPVGHNVGFDNGFLSYALNLHKLNLYSFIYEEAIDTMKLSKAVWCLTGEEKINLNACCEFAGIKLTDAHGAMNDVMATAELFRYFVKKMRSNKGSTSSTEIKQREKGADFFEFKCAK